MKILVVEDEYPVQRLAGMILRDEGHEVVIAETCDEGLTMLMDEKPDFVMTDLNTPGQAKGWDVYQAAQAAQIPVLMVSAGLQGGYHEKATELALPYYELLSKPFSIPALPSAIERTLIAARAVGLDKNAPAASQES